MPARYLDACKCLFIVEKEPTITNKRRIISQESSHGRISIEAKYRHRCISLVLALKAVSGI